ncbi:uncharacterized protein LACBIDRAFT_303938 [Laccaria bicolor S238N-H82]|uniref:Predicted protein n=1 Tax=Laccaria bicolor (strain S238N-H82 / ATCC MYA-4686) TaxID=486041 RepID=B0E4A0_LACBS|nr:uncharacterized protein LACBIDRAFT_303938 [Laccaria bicolor S238N-H82]EDQ98331.1 predicted protein [Laccaria bicolor S238N-H82]|eukprot:XP_001891018.1 predicted protein [Laccaria bicolor S238N-H82]
MTSANSSTQGHYPSSAHKQAPSTMACLYVRGSQCWWVIPTNCPESVIGIGITVLCVTGQELMKRRRRGKVLDERCLGSRESWEFGYLYQGRCWARFPSPPTPKGWPLSWVKQAIQFPEDKLNQLRGLDTTLYIQSVLYHPPHNPHGLHWIPLDFTTYWQYPQIWTPLDSQHKTGLHWTPLDCKHKTETS